MTLDLSIIPGGIFAHFLRYFAFIDQKVENLFFFRKSLNRRRGLRIFENCNYDAKIVISTQKYI